MCNSSHQDQTPATKSTRLKSEFSVTVPLTAHCNEKVMGDSTTPEHKPIRTRQLRSVSRSLTQDATRHLVQSLILSRIDYCNVAFAGLPQRSIIRLQAVINAAARLILRVKKFDHISTLLRDELQWLKIGERIKFKLSIL